MGRWSVVVALFRDVVNASFFLGRPEPPFRTGLCFTADVSFFLFRHSFSELARPIALKLCHMVAIWLNFIILLQKFGGCSPKKIWGQKYVKFRSILHHFRLWSRISPERLKISKIGRRYKLWQFLLRQRKKSRELWSTNGLELHVSLDPQKMHFWHTISRPLGGAAPRNFYMR